MNSRLFITACLTSLAWAQPAAPPPPATRDLEQLAGLTRAAPPELAAGALLRLAGAAPESSRSLKKDLIQEAFDTALYAKFPARKFSVAPHAFPIDSDFGMVYSGLARGVDSLSLQTRAVQAMLAIDRAKAMEMFNTISLDRIPSTPCEEPMMVWVDPYYQTAAQLYKDAFGPVDRKNGEDIRFLERLITAVNSPPALRSAASMLSTIDLSGDESRRLMALYIGSMSRVDGSDRDFTGTLKLLFDAVNSLDSTGDYWSPLMSGFRAYVVRHAHKTRCEDSVDPKVMGANFDAAVNAFNTAATKRADPNLKPFSDVDLKPGGLDGKAQIYLYWQKPRTRSLVENLKRLRFGLAGYNQTDLEGRRKDGLAPILKLEKREDPQWEAAARDYLGDLEAWRKDPGDEDDLAYFHQTTILYGGLAEIAPPGLFRDRVLKSLLAFLAESPVALTCPPQWQLEVRNLAIRSRGSNQWFRDELLRANHPVLNLYGQLMMRGMDF